MTERRDTAARGAPAAAAVTAGPADVTVNRVEGRADLNAFIKLPWRIYRDDPHWVAPLLMDVRSVLDRSKHPFHKHADVEYFLARRNDVVIGRIAAIVNHVYNEFHGELTGFFGLFECADDAAAARALLDTAEEWLLARGMKRVLGPMNLSTNDELGSPGFLIEGFDTPPTVMMSHGRPYYGALAEGAGYTKAKDLLAYWVEGGEPPERMVRITDRLARSVNMKLRALDMKRLDEEVEVIQEIYNSAWERNWGFVPLTAEEILHLARQLKPVVNPHLVALAYIDDEPVGFVLGLPDLNQALRHTNGRLFPTGLFKFLWHRRDIDHIRVLTLGLKPKYRLRGLDAALIVHVFREAAKYVQPRGECSWILEDNFEMRNGLERMGGHAYKRYRVYEKPLVA